MDLRVLPGLTVIGGSVTGDTLQPPWRSGALMACARMGDEADDAKQSASFPEGGRHEGL